jgi:hypothetical protein
MYNDWSYFIPVGPAIGEVIGPMKSQWQKGVSCVCCSEDVTRCARRGARGRRRGPVGPVASRIHKTYIQLRVFTIPYIVVPVLALCRETEDNLPNFGKDVRPSLQPSKVWNFKLQAQWRSCWCQLMSFLMLSETPKPNRRIASLQSTRMHKKHCYLNFDGQPRKSI